MQSRIFMVEIDGRKVLVDQMERRVSILDGQGAVVFRDRIQVAAGSVQGLFTAALDGGAFGVGTEPAPRA